jgi:hypothetical protein
MSSFGRTFWLVAVIALLLTGVVYGQSVVSAQAGLINYIEGQVTLDGKDVARKAGLYPQVKENGVLKTGEGRVELLLSPGAFLRMSENSSLRMITTRLVDTRLEVVGGTVLVECAEMTRDTGITLVYKDSTVTLRKKGLYRLDAEAPQFSVLDGEAVVAGSGQQLTLKDGKRTSLAGVYVAEKFDPKAGDALYRWSRRRSEYLAMANVSMARSLAGSGYTSSSSRWFYNPWMNLYTFVPYNGFYYSPFGYCYYSPRTVYVVYNPPQQSGGRDWRTGWTQSQLGYSTVHQTSAGTSGILASSPSVSQSAPVSSAPPASSVSRDSGHAGGAGR